MSRHLDRFHAMRADLVARGLIDADYRLTPAGDAYVADIIAELRSAPPPAPEAAIRWNTTGRISS